MIEPGEIIRHDDFINNSEKDPGNDEGRVPKLEADEKIHIDFLSFNESFEAQEDITIGQPVGSSTIQNQIARALRITPTDWVNAPAIIKVVDIISVDTNKYILLFTKTVGSYEPPRAVAFTVGDDNVITFGTDVTTTGTTGTYHAGICKLDTNKFVVVSSEDSSNNCVKATVCTVSGTTITQGMTQDLTGDIGVVCANCVQIDTDKFAFIGYTYDTTSSQIGLCTVSGTVITVVDTDTIPNGVRTGQYLRMAKINTDKFVIVNGTNGNSVVCTSVSSTLVVGSVLSTVLNPRGDYENTAVVSLENDTFWYLIKGYLLYCTVSGTTITNVDYNTIAGHTTGTLFLDGTDVMEVRYSSTANTSGIYKLTCPVSTIIATKQFPLVMVGTNGIRAIDDAMTGYVILDDSHYHIEGMSFNFIGIAQETKSKGDQCKVKILGKDSNQTGLIAGATYTPINGVLENTFDTTITPKLKALSATEILI